MTETETVLLRTIETFLRDHAMPATKFGRLAANDPRFVSDLRIGRIPRRDTELRTRAWMRGYADRAKIEEELVVVSGADLAEALPFIDWGLGSLSGSQDVVARLTLAAAPPTGEEG
jgi:hypothetical protein